MGCVHLINDSDSERDSPRQFGSLSVPSRIPERDTWGPETRTSSSVCTFIIWTLCCWGGALVFGDNNWWPAHLKLCAERPTSVCTVTVNGGISTQTCSTPVLFSFYIVFFRLVLVSPWKMSLNISGEKLAISTSQLDDQWHTQNNKHTSGEWIRLILFVVAFVGEIADIDVILSQTQKE